MRQQQPDSTATAPGSVSRRGVRTAISLLLAAAAMAACTMDAPTSQTSMAPLVDPADLPIATVATTTTIVASSDPSAPLLSVLPDGDCAFADAISGGEITFAVGTRLFGASPDGRQVRCLATLGTDQRSPARWSPIANRVLLGWTSVIDIIGTRPTGVDQAAPRPQWSAPNGDALLALSVTGRSLAERDALDPARRTDITFLTTQTLVVAHPSGRALIGVGTASDSTTGIFIAGAHGESPRPIAIAITGTTVVEAVASPTGDALLLIVESGDTSTVRRLSLSDLSLLDLSSAQTPMALLTPGVDAASLAWRTGLCNTITETRAIDPRSGTDVVVGLSTPLAGRSVAPIGWLDTARLVVAARPFGCDGPADVWIWNQLDGSATLLVKNVDYPSVRMLQSATPLPVLGPEAQPPLL